LPKAIIGKFKGYSGVWLSINESFSRSELIVRLGNDYKLKHHPRLSMGGHVKIPAVLPESCPSLGTEKSKVSDTSREEKDSKRAFSQREGIQIKGP